MQLTVRDASTTYKMTEDGEFVCAHEEAYIEKACCSGVDSDGLIACGCHGQDGIICPALDCDGIQEHEIQTLIDWLTPEEPDYA